MAQPLRIGLCTDQNMPWEKTVERWQHFERLGFDSVWDCDHYVQPSRPTGPYYEGWTLLAGLAARTERIRIGVLVSCNTFRHPALLAKEAATVDHISNGRLELGLGAGWYVPEHEMFGIPFPAPAELVGRFREAVEIVDHLMRNEVHDLRRAVLPIEGCRLPPASDPAAAPAAHPRRARAADAEDRRAIRGSLELPRHAGRNARPQRHPG